jgi:SNF2 family DNA or RNA helicase
MEPVMTPALEAQAIGRSHRMGQQRAVTVTKFFIKARLLN